MGDLEVIGVTSSSLLIPENLLIIYQKLEIKKNRREILAYLLRKYKFFLGNWQFRSSRKIKTLFQDSGLDLKRISFKPRNSDWLELGTIAMGFGVSRTYLFSYLLELEDRGLGDFFDIPQIRNVVTY
ncbi:MAG: DUF1564 family protein, partial [Leptospiraceae bacterium]|nr:DUF1564 family protein [Leptospiraceae bacterium]